VRGNGRAIRERPTSKLDGRSADKGVVDLPLLGVQRKLHEVRGDVVVEALDVVDVRLPGEAEGRAALGDLLVERLATRNRDVRVRTRLGNPRKATSEFAASGSTLGNTSTGDVGV